MSRANKNRKLDTRSSRLKLACQEEPYWIALAPGKHFGYYRPADRGAGTWRCRLYDPETRRRSKHAIGTADDFEDADGINTLDFIQAQAMANKWFDQARAIATGKRTHKGPFTVRDAWQAYEENAERRGMKGLDRTRCAAELHILPALGNVVVDKLTKDKVMKWLHAMSVSPARVRTKKGAKEPAQKAAPKTDDEKRARKDSANRILTILKAMLNHAREEGRTFANVDAWGKKVAFRETTKTRIRFLSPEESQRLVNVCSADFRRLVQGALFTGARFGELVRLQVRDFDSKGGTVFIAESKSGKSRHLVLTEEGTAFFQEMAAGLKGDDLIFTREAFPDMRRVEPETGKPMPKVSRAWKRGDQSRFMVAACEMAGLEPLSFHELRHTHASSLVNAGVPLVFIAKQLGHANTLMTEKHYGHLAPSAMAEAIRTLAPKLGIHTPGKVAALKIKKA